MAINIPMMVATHMAINKSRRRGSSGGSSGGGDPDDFMLAVLVVLGIVVIFMVSILALNHFGYRQQRTTIYQVKTFACSDGHTETEICKVTLHDLSLTKGTSADLDTSTRGYPYTHKRKHHRYRDLACDGYYLEDACEFTVLKVVDPGKWVEVP
jgi:hypothetical protein